MDEVHVYGSQRMPARSLDETEIFLEARLRVAAGRSGAGVACGSAECQARGGRVGRTQALQSTGFAAGPSAIRKRPAQLGKEVEAFERQLRRHHPPHFASVRFLGPESCSHSACRGITSSLQQACDVGLPNCPTSRLQMYKVFIVLLLVLGGCRVLPQPLRTLLQGGRREGQVNAAPDKSKVPRRPRPKRGFPPCGHVKCHVRLCQRRPSHGPMSSRQDGAIRASPQRE